MTSSLTVSTTSIGFVHPGQMGSCIASIAAGNGYATLWASEGRSAATAARANDIGIEDAGDLQNLCDRSDVLFSICPPDQAVAVADAVAGCGFSGIYVDGNAVSPATGVAAAQAIARTDASFVDGGIIGPPAKRAGTTRFYLSGENASAIAGIFDNTIIDARVVGDEVGAASALKMAFAGWSKGSTALLLNQLALARSQGVEAALIDEWAMSHPGNETQIEQVGPSSAAKAWRFVGEMNEIADSLEAAGLPREWFDGAAETYSRLADFKDNPNARVDDIINTMLGRDSS